MPVPRDAMIFLSFFFFFLFGGSNNEERFEVKISRKVPRTRSRSSRRSESRGFFGSVLDRPRSERELFVDVPRSTEEAGGLAGK